MADVRVSGRGKWLVAAALVVGILLMLTVVLALAAPERSIPHGATNLSADPALDSSFADVAVSPDGDRVVVVWPEEIEGLLLPRPRGSVWLRWASESAEGGWSAPLSVFAGAEQGCAVESAVAVTGTTAHVAYLIWIPCQDTTQSVISYTTCDMGGGNCGAARTVTSAPFDASAPGLSGVDMALDNGGDPHFVYTLFEGEITATVYYSTGNLYLAERVSEEGKYNHSPAIAWSGGYVHVVWEDETEYEIVYRRRDGGGWGEIIPESILTRFKGDDEYRPRNPDVAAYGGQVMVTWDWEWPEMGADQYVVAYRRYLGGTGSWLDSIYEVGTQAELVGEGLNPEAPGHAYTSTKEFTFSEYTPFLRPTVALDGEGMPTVVWHVDRGTYDIMYTQALSVTENDIFVWSEPAVFNQNTQGHSASPVVALAPVISPSLHVAYLQRRVIEDEVDWETYYSSEEEGGSSDYPYAVFLPMTLRDFFAGGEK